MHTRALHTHARMNTHKHAYTQTRRHTYARFHSQPATFLVPYMKQTCHAEYVGQSTLPSRLNPYTSRRVAASEMFSLIQCCEAWSLSFSRFPRSRLGGGDGRTTSCGPATEPIQERRPSLNFPLSPTAPWHRHPLRHQAPAESLQDELRPSPFRFPRLIPLSTLVSSPTVPQPLNGAPRNSPNTKLHLRSAGFFLMNLNLQ